MIRKNVFPACLLSSVLFVPGALWAFPENHGPFEPGRAPKRFPIKECRSEVIRKADDKNPVQVEELTTGDAKFPEKIKLSWNRKTYVAVIEIMREGKTVAGPYTVRDARWGPSPNYWADLNNDGRTDFIFGFWPGGTGLAFSYYFLLFVISEKENYKRTKIFTAHADDNDFVDFEGDGVCEYVHTSFVFGYSEAAKDGKWHNYWVYNILGIRDGSLYIANEKDKRFPKWVWYTFKPNHKETTLITEKQKAKLWKEHIKKQPIFIKDTTPKKRTTPKKSAPPKKKNNNNKQKKKPSSSHAPGS